VPSSSNAQRLPLSVVIPARNAAATLADQLEVVVPQAEAFEGEVVVVDNCSTDATPRIVEEWAARSPAVQLVRCGRPGVNPARNAGVRAARSDVVLLCDADDVAADGWVAAMAGALASDPLVGGAVETGRLNSAFLQEVRAGGSPWSSSRLPESHSRPYAIGCNLGFRREVFDRVGGFDESFPHAGADEIDFCWRAQDAGYPVTFVPAALVHVRWRAELRGLVRQSFAHARGTAYLSRKLIASGAVPQPSLYLQLAMCKAYWRRLAGVGRLTDRVAQWRLAVRLAWVVGSIVELPRSRVLV
jgi:glycosyltransferase involved in cell wall biosynthesis